MKLSMYQEVSMFRKYYVIGRNKPIYNTLKNITCLKFKMAAEIRGFWNKSHISKYFWLKTNVLHLGICYWTQ